MDRDGWRACIPGEELAVFYTVRGVGVEILQANLGEMHLSAAEISLCLLHYICSLLSK